MLKKMICGTLIVSAMSLTALTTSSASTANTELPGEGIRVQPARASWNTGFFQEALVRKGLSELGYKVKKPKDLSPPIFYKSVTLGDIDYWTNGWFPMHDAQLPKNFEEKAQKVGYVIKAGGMQGYMVSKKEADKFGITSLADFKREEVKKAFDKNNNGKADLVACPGGWACEKIIDHHLDVYGLEDDVTPIKASYEAAMAGALAEYRNDEPVFFYTWAPNWTIFKMKPGKDVVWINVPEIKPTEAQKSAAERMTAENIDGAVSNPIKLGFVVSDVQIVANKKFLAKNPAAKRFFEVFTLPLSDINEQNTRMNEGEKSRKDINRHADEWIAKHTTLWNSWLNEARKAVQ
ncbi:glycine betaine/L-proline ABC transporter substrate-binding protein ProX [Desulfotalea psychrophila]|uniref:Probable glycine betaine/L-proline binding protein (ProX) n=1 Tax=Desulfotalea psychrophila (strain LSv54 / DSM 12343) TaxID=177439 RepID=Q6ART8_DESPS|nr:glycine betaine/L-proline ABC transporter substrate-binding protein ProX [Desulfotalea psychrophila]CAG34937.1 probable glycine betaine/L-proline binding protein (ProX) [Desulfotalea psychrophila LSv54]